MPIREKQVQTRAAPAEQQRVSLRAQFSEKFCESVRIAEQRFVQIFASGIGDNHGQSEAFQIVDRICETVERFTARKRYQNSYGYAVLRAAVARGLTGSGLLCAAGIHHSNQYNPFGLADDVMEPFRPFVDEMVFSSRDFFAVPELGKEQKAELLRLLTADVMSGTEKRPLLNSIRYTSASLVRCFLREETRIQYPEFVKR